MHDAHPLSHPIRQSTYFSLVIPSSPRSGSQAGSCEEGGALSPGVGGEEAQAGQLLTNDSLNRIFEKNQLLTP